MSLLSLPPHFSLARSTERCQTSAYTSPSFTAVISENAQAGCVGGVTTATHLPRRLGVSLLACLDCLRACRGRSRRLKSSCQELKSSHVHVHAERARCSQEERGREDDNEGDVVVARGPILPLEVPHTLICVGVDIMSPVGPLQFMWVEAACGGHGAPGHRSCGSVWRELLSHPFQHRKE